MTQLIVSAADPVSPVGRDFVIGDVHGCYDELRALLALFNLTPHDRVHFVGDGVDRGPYPKQCVELMMQHQTVLGNHEEATLRRRLRDKDTLAPHHRHTIEQLEQQHFDWLETLPLYLELPRQNAVVVHAGIVPGVPLSLQKPYFLLHGQNLRPPAADDTRGWRPTGETWYPSKAPAGTVFWADAYENRSANLALRPFDDEDFQPQLVLYGHTVFERPYVQKYSIGLDTGCCFGMNLTAVELPSRRIYQVPAQKQYYASRRNTVTLPNGIVAYS